MSKLRRLWSEVQSEARTAGEELSEADLAALESGLDRSAGPSPEPPATADLVARLRPVVRANRREAMDEDLETVLSIPAPTRATAFANWIRLARAQVSLFKAPFWLATALLTLLGLILEVSTGLPVLVFVAPILAAMGVAFAFRPGARGTWEMESACPIKPAEWLFARFTVVVADDLILMLLATLVVGQTDGRVALWRLILSWFGPLVLLSGVALQASLRWGWLAGTALPLGLWGLWALRFERALFLPGSNLVVLTGQGPSLLWGLALLTGLALVWTAPASLPATGSGGMPNEM